MQLETIEFFAEGKAVWVVDSDTQEIIGLASCEEEAKNIAKRLEEIVANLVDDVNFNHVRTGRKVIPSNAGSARVLTGLLEASHSEEEAKNIFAIKEDWQPRPPTFL